MDKGVIVAVGILLVGGLIFGLMAGMPVYSVWSQGKAGEAELERAKQNRQIKIEEAQAAKESAEFLADAEIIRAKGVAQANEIIGTSLQDNEAYLRYLWIQGLHDGNGETIYVATEANLPILEATRGVK